LSTLRGQASDPRRVLMLGAAGGVAGATLALLDQHPLGRALLPAGSELLLLDRSELRAHVPTPPGARWLPPVSIESADELAQLIDRHRVDEVIELAVIDTWDSVRVCAEAGASFLSTTFDTWEGTELLDPDDARCMLRARGLFAPPDIDAGVHLVCMGMNPGLVNLLAAAGLRELARRSGRPPSLAELDIHAIVFTEIDETQVEPTVAGASSDGVFASSWCPEGCLDEVLEPSAMINVAGEITSLDHAPHRGLYRARCGAEEIVGHLVPHEELVSLAAMYPTVELAYVYRMPPAAEAALAAAPDRRADDWVTRRLYPPDHGDELRGFNRIGALICSRTLGELWIGWQTPVALGRRFASNATLLQVAAGVIAGWTALRELDPGIWLPEELDHERVLGLACEILGPLSVVWSRDAPVRGVLERRVAGL
jgi:homospermidine synthase